MTLLTSILSANLKTTAAAKMLTRRERKGGMGGGAPGLSWLYKRNLSYRQALLASPNHLVLCHSRLEVGPNTWSQRVGSKFWAQTSPTATILP